MLAPKTIILRITRQSDDALVRDITIVTDAREPVVVENAPGLRFTLIDPATGIAPPEVHVEQVGSDLHIDLDPEREDDEPRTDLVLQGCQAEAEGLDGRRRDDEDDGVEACAVGGYVEGDGAWLPYEATDFSAFDTASRGTFVLPGDGAGALGYLLGGAAIAGAAAVAGGGSSGETSAPTPEEPQPEEPQPEEPQPEEPQPEEPQPEEPQPEEPQPEEPQPEEPVSTEASFIIYGSVAAGPVYAGATVEAYGDQGQLLGSASINDDGSYRIEVPEGASDYLGPVLLRVVDANGDVPNFKDEVTGADRSLDTALRALSWAGEENTLFFQRVGTDAELEINITPITELAAREAVGDALAPPASRETIDTTNDAVARAFNLIDDNGMPIPLTGPAVPTNSGRFNGEDGVSGAERYGVALAKLSGMDAATGSIDATLDALEADFDAAGGGFTQDGLAAIDAGRQAALDALKEEGTDDPTFAGEDTALNRWLLGDVTIDEQAVSETGLLTVRGTALPGTTVTVTLPNGSDVSTEADAAGNFEVTSSTPVSREQLIATPVEAEAADVLAAPTDVRAPLAPQVEIQGQATVSGTGEPDSLVDLVAADGTVLASAIPVDGDGNWLADLATPTGAGLTVRASYEDGTPSAPVGDTPYTPVVNPISEEGPISGYAEPGTTVTLTLPDGSTIQALADSVTGEFLVANPGGLADGDEVEAVATDGDGNSGAPGTGIVDAAAPTATPEVVQADGETTVTLPAGAEMATVELTPAGATAPITVTLARDPVAGDWSVTDGSLPLEAALDPATGELTLPNTALTHDTPVTVIATDGDGVASEPGMLPGTGRVDAEAPAAPTLVKSDGNVIVTPPGDGAAMSVEFTPAGAASPETVEIAKDPISGDWGVSDGNLPNGAKVDPATGKVTFPGATLAAGETVTVTATDEAGNESDPASLVGVTVDPVVVDATAPQSPVVTQTDGTTKAEFPADADEAVLEYTPAGATTPVQTTVSRKPDGSWPTPDEAGLPTGSEITEDAAGKPVVSIPNEALADGTPVSATAVDAAGNESEPAGLKDETGAPATVDATGPDAPEVSQVGGETIVELPADTQEAVVTYTPDGATSPVDNTIARKPDGSWPTADEAGLPAGSSISEDPVTGAPTISIPNEALTEGSEVTATGTDAAGNPSAEGSVAPIDATAPSTPKVNPIADDAATVTGSAEPGSTVTITFPDGSTETVTADDNGDFTAPVPAGVTLAAGDLIAATAADAAGNESEPANQPVRDADVELPATPTLDPVNGSDPITGSADPGATVALLDDKGEPLTDGNGDPITAIADDNGNFVLDNPGLADETPIQVTATDEAGNESVPLEATVDASAPLAPVMAQTDGAVVTEVPEDAVTTTVSFTPVGAIEPTVVTLVKDPISGWGAADEEGDKLPVGSTVAADGTVTMPASTLEDGSSVTVQLADEAGNTSTGALDPVDSTAPTAPTLDPVDTTDGLVTGKADPGSQVTVTFPDGSAETVTADDNGDFVAPVPAGITLAEGDPIVAAAVDAAGNESEPVSEPVAGVDSTPPAQPLVDPINRTDPITGTAEPGSTVALLDNSGQPLLNDQNDPVTATVNPDGSFALENPGTLDNLEFVKVVATDAAGNESAPATESVDGEAPAAPGLIQADGAVTVDLLGDGEAATLTYSTPVGEPRTVELVTDPVTGEWRVAEDSPAQLPVGSTIAGGQVSLPQGSLANGSPVTATVTDDAGNESAPASVTVDTIAPIVPDLDVPQIDNIGPGTTAITGVAEPGSVVTLILPDGTELTTTAGANGGAFAVEIPDGVILQEGQPIVATATDSVGNESEPTTEYVGGSAGPAAPVLEQAVGETVVTLPADGLAGFADPATAKVTYVLASGGAETVLLDRDGSGNWKLADGQSLSASPQVTAYGALSLANDALVDGSELTAIAYSDGETLASDEVTLLVDSAAPAATLTQLADGVELSVPVDADSADLTFTPAGATDPVTVTVSRDPVTGEWGIPPDESAALPAGSTVDPVTGTVTVPGDGLAEGSPVLATVSDAAGNESPEEALDLAPAAPLVAQAAGTVSVTLPNDVTVDAAAVSYTDATGNPQSIFLSKDDQDVWRADAPLPTGVAVSPEGALTIPSTAIEDGSDVTATATATGGTPAADDDLISVPVTLTVDSGSPAAPAVEQADGEVTVVLPTDAELADLAFTPAGATDPVTATLVNDSVDGWILAAGSDPLPEGSTIDPTTGEVTLPNEALEDGTAVTATATDGAGNESDPGTLLADDGTAPATVDSTAPVAPSVTQPGDGTVTVSLPGKDEDTASVTFTPTGQTEPVIASLVDDPVDGWTLAAGSDPLPEGSTIDPVTGEVTLPNEALENGTPVTASATDPAGNKSAPGSLLEDDGVTAATVDSSMPAAPQLEAMDATDTLITGTAEPGATILVTFPDGSTTATTANGSGNFTVAAPTDVSGNPTLNPGDVVTAQQQDSAGNVSPSSNETVGGIDTTAPTQPTALLANQDGNGDGVPDGSTVTGEAEPGATVELRDPAGDVIGTTTADPQGNYIITLDTLDAPLADGTVYDVVAIDVAGNDSTPATVTGDTISPTAPTLDSVVNTDGDGDGTPEITTVVGSVPTDEGIEAIELRDPQGQVVGTATPDSTGAFTITTDEPLADGTDYELVAVDGVGNESPVTTVAGDTSAPNPPPTRLDASVDTGTDGDNLTSVDDQPLVLSNADSSASEGDIITVYAADGTTVLGTTTAGSDGAWSVTLDSDTADGETDNDPYAEGSYDFQITATDPAGNESAPTALTVEVDTTAPNAPAITSPVTGDTLSDATPTVTGTGEVGDTVTLYGPDGTTPIGETTVGPDGTWAITPEEPLDEGTAIELTARATDPAGNPSTDSTVTIDLATSLPAPTATLAAASDSEPTESGVGGTNGDGLTNDSTPTLEGTGTDGDTITIYDGPDPTTASVLGTTTVDGNDAWTFTIPSGAELADGAYNFAVTASRGSLESAPVTVPVTVDTLVVQPSLALDPASDTGATDDGITSDVTPTITGTGATPGDVIKLYADDDGSYADGSERGVGTVAQDGSWSITVADALSAGQHALTVIAYDSAGNKSLPSGALTVEVVLAASKGPLAGIDPTSDSGTSGDGITSDPTPTISGSGATPGDTITLYGEDGTTPLGTATVDDNGDWAITPIDPLPGGRTDLQVTATDAAGSESPATIVPVTIDTTAPTITVTRVSGDDLAPTDTTGSYDAFERWSDPADYGNTALPVNLNPFIRGTSDAPDGSVVVGTLNGDLFSTTVTAGEWAFSLSSEQSNALVHGSVYDITVTVTDAAGNSTTDSSKKLAVDIAPPDTPTVAVLQTTDTTPVLTGSAQKVDPVNAGSYLSLADGDTLSVTVNGVEVSGVIGALPTGLSYNAADNSWSLDTSQVTALAEGGASALTTTDYDVSVAVTASGITKEDISSNELSIADPSITVDALSEGFLNEAETGQPQVITGSTTAVPAGSLVTVTATPTATKTGSDITLGTAIVQADGSYSLQLSATQLASLLAGTENGDAANDAITLGASVNAFGTTVSDSASTIVDVTPPAIVDLPDLTETSLGRTGTGASTDYGNDITSTVANAGTEALVTPLVEPNATVQVYFQRQQVTETVTADANGVFTLPVPATDGSGNTFILERNDRIVFTATDEAGNVGEPWVEYYDPVPLIDTVRFAARDGVRLDQLNAGDLIDEQTVATTDQDVVAGITIPYADVTMSYVDAAGATQAVTTSADEFGAYRFDLLTGQLVEGTFALTPALVDRTDDGTDNPTTYELALTDNSTSATVVYNDAGSVERTITITRDTAGNLSASGIPAGSGVTLEGNSLFLPNDALQGGTDATINGTEVIPNSVPERVVLEGATVTVSERYTFASTDPARQFREVDDGTINDRDADTVEIKVDFNRDVILDTTGGSPELKVMVGDEAHFAAFDRVEDNNTLVFKLTIEPGMTDLDGLSIPVSDTQATSGGSDVDHSLEASDPAIFLNGAVIYDRERFNAGEGELGAWLDYFGAAGNGTPDNASYKVDTTAPTPSVTIFGVSTNLNQDPYVIDGDGNGATSTTATEVGDFNDELSATQYSQNQGVWIGGRVDGEYNTGDKVTLTVRYLDFPAGFNEQSTITASDDPTNASVSPELIEKTITVTADVQADGTWKTRMYAQDLAADADLRIEARLDTFDTAGNRAVAYDTHKFTLGFFNVMSAQGLNDIADVATDQDPASSTNDNVADLYGSMNNVTLLPFLQNTSNFGTGEEGVTAAGIYDKNVNVLTDANWGLRYSDMRVSTVMFEGETQTFGNASDNSLNTYSTASWGDKYYTANHFVRDGKVLLIANDNWHYGAFKYDTETQVNPYRWYDGGSLAAAFDFVGTYDDLATPYARGALVGVDPVTGVQAANYNVNFATEAELDALSAPADAIAAAKQILDGVFGTIYGETLSVATETDTFTIHEQALTERDVVLARDDNGNALIVLRQHGGGYVMLSADQDIFDSSSVGDALSTGTVNEVLAGNAFAWADQYGARPANAEVNFESRPDYQPRHEGGQGWYYYRVGDTVSVKLTVDGNVDVDTTNGLPTIDIDIAGTTWEAELRTSSDADYVTPAYDARYESITGDGFVYNSYYNQTELVFDFVITDDVDSDYWYQVTRYSEGIHLPGNGFDANGAVITVNGEAIQIEYGDFRQSYEPYPDGWKYNPYQMVNTAPATPRAEVANGGLGFDLQSAGDFNGDGFEDFMVTAPGLVDGGSNREGRVYVVYGSENGLPSNLDLENLKASEGVIIDTSTAGGDNWGYRMLTSLGDFNGDGYDEIMMTGHFADSTTVIWGGERTTAGDTPYTVRIYEDIVLSTYSSKEGFQITGSGSWWGTAGTAGDFNNDGYADLMTGNAETSYGKATIIYGGDFAINSSGGSVGRDSNVMSNILVDLNGSTYFSGPLKRVDDAFAYELMNSTNLFAESSSSSGFEWFGSQMAGRVDLNNDGLQDLIISDPYTDVTFSDGSRERNAGSVWIIYGQEAGVSVGENLAYVDVTDAADENLGIDRHRWLIPGDGDVQKFDIRETDLEQMVADGLAIRIDGTQRDEALGGVLGPVTRESLVLGQTITSLGDINGDGFADLAIAAPSYGNTSDVVAGDGRVYVLYGSETGLVFTDRGDADNILKLDSLAPSEGFIVEQAVAGEKDTLAHFGFAVQGMGDVNGDGIDDFMIGAPEADGDTLLNNGAVYLVWGSGNGLPMTANVAYAEGLVAAGQAVKFEGVDVRDYMGTNMAMGDWNGDGLADFVIPRYASETFTPNLQDPVFGQGVVTINAGTFDVFSGTRYADMTAAFDSNEANRDDVIATTAGQNRDGSGVARVTGGLGDDTITGIGANGGDVGYGGHGDDIIGITSLGFTRVDGGLGVDTLRFDGSGLALNFTTLGERVQGFEIFDLNGGGNTLTLRLSDILDQPEQSGVDFSNLQVLGSSGDAVALDGGLVSAGGIWEQKGTESVNGVTYDVYSHTGLDAANVFDDVWIQQGVTVS